MRNKLVYKYIGKVLIGFALLLFCPIIVALYYKESITPFLIPSFISVIAGIILSNLKPKNKNLYAKDGFCIVTVSWIIISLIGCIPFIVGDNLSFFDAFFETVSGLTTTGATIFNDVEHLPNSLLFWRSFTHFIGGMGVLAFVMAIVPLSKNDKSMHVLKAEMPGPTVSKMVPSIKKTLFILYGIYIGLILLMFSILLIGGLTPFHAINIALSTAGTGGFSILNNSIASYTPFIQWTVTIFMFLFGINFNIYFLILMNDTKTALKSEELRVYLLLYLFSVIFIVANTYQMFDTLSEAIRHGAFHISSLMTSTGSSIGDINIYPTSCRILCLCLMLISACAGSTCGGFKISRLLICIKSIKRDILKTFHPNSIRTITFEGKKVEEDTVKSTRSFLLLYAAIIVILMFLISFDGFTLDQTINAVFTTFGNVGLCFDISTFTNFSNFSKFILSIGMLFGRLEIFPIIVWASTLRKKSSF